MPVVKHGALTRQSGLLPEGNTGESLCLCGWVGVVPEPNLSRIES